MLKNFPSLLKYKNLIFCDNAGGSQVPFQVIKQVNNYIKQCYAQPYSYNKLSKIATKKLFDIDIVTSRILNNKTGKIVYNTSASNSMYLLANSFQKLIQKKLFLICEMIRKITLKR